MHIRQPKVCKNMQTKFECTFCDYKCSRKFLWDQHLSTRKHTKATQATPLHTATASEKVILHSCEVCGRQYKQRSGLWRHKKKCKINENKILSEFNINNNDEMKLLVKEMMTHMTNQGKIINEMLPRIGNNYNNYINLNVFLNENCRDAINMSDFIKSLQIKFADLDYIKNNGLMEGISTLFVNNLNQLDTCKRPIHCTDIKKETLYIKDNNEWEKDHSKQKLKLAIGSVSQKQSVLAISDWEKKNPNWHNTAEGKDEYIKLVQNLMSDIEDTNQENKIIKNIVKSTIINENQIISN